MQVLVYILSRAVSDVPVSSASIVMSTQSRKYYIGVRPNHPKYWEWFKRRHPNSIHLAQSRGARVKGVTCPEFTTAQAVLEWLSDTLGLSCGERNLLRLCSGVVGRRAR